MLDTWRSRGCVAKVAGTCVAGELREVAEVHELMSKALEKLNRHAEAESELAQAKQIRSQLAGRGSRQAPDASAGSGETAAMSGSGQQELRSMLMRTPHGAELPNSREAEYVKRVSTMLGEAYHNLGVIDARAARYSNAEEEFAEAARWNPKIEAWIATGTGRFPRGTLRTRDWPARAPASPNAKGCQPSQMLGLSYYMTDQFAKSAETFRPILDALPRTPDYSTCGVHWCGWRCTHRRTPFFANVGARRELSEVHLMVGQAHYGQSHTPTRC